MNTRLAAADRMLARLSRGKILIVASFGVGCIAGADNLTGYEISMDEFYLGPVALAAWYAGVRASIGIAVLSSIGWLFADISAGLLYSHLAVPVWNTLVRTGFFLIGGFLVVAVRNGLSHQRRLARTDSLTGAFSRRAFEERLEHDLDLARRMRSPLTLAFVDLDNFKTLNDTRGHSAGDQALRATSLVLQGATRRSDTVARLGGDEFAIVLPDTDGRRAEEVVARLRRDLRQALDPIAPEPTCSIGVITFENTPLDATEAIRAADALMYDAKRKGKNTVTFSVVAARETVQPRAAADRPQAGGR